jgi:hypothetical protein
MPAPLIGLAVGAAARLAAKKAAQTGAKKSVKKAMTTGKAKIQAAKDNPSKKYEPPVKGSGKPKYQNVIKEARLQPKKASTPTSLSGRKLNAEQIKRKAQKNPNLAKEIDREAKIKKGQITAKPKTPKVPVKKTK